MDPREWLKLAYETFGAKHPIGSLVCVMILFALFGGAVWMLGANLYEKSHPAEHSTTRSPSAPTQTAAQCGVNVDGNGNKIGDVNCKTDPQAEKH